MNESNPYDTRHYFKRAIELVRDHPGIALSAGYGVVSLIGIMFSWSLFSQFGITYFQYADISDFLLAAIREPMTFIMAASAIVVAMLLIRMSYGSQKFYRRYMDKFFLFRWAYAIDRFGTTGIGFIFVLIAYTFLFITMYGAWKSRQIRDGEGTKIRVTMTSEATAALGEQTGKPLTLLGTTSRYVFLYSPRDDQSFIIPADNIAALYPVDSSHDSSLVQVPPGPAPEVKPSGNQTETELEASEKNNTEKESD